MFPLQLLHAVPRLPLPHVPPIHREGRVALEAARLMRDPVFRGDGMPRGEGRPVLLIPGFMAGGGSPALVTPRLRDLRYPTKSPRIPPQPACSTTAGSGDAGSLECPPERTGP